MQQAVKMFIVYIFVFVSASVKLSAQKTDDPGAYMTAINNTQVEMNKTYLAYMSQVAHSKNAKKIENMRQKTLESITNSKYKVIDLPYYKGDNSLRKSSIDYIDLCYKVFNDDYAHIVNMEEIAEQSFDEMQAYLLLKQKTNEKLHEAADSSENAARRFAAKYNVTLIEGGKDELNSKMDEANKVYEYKDKIFLLFFKCNWQDGQITDAINKNNLGNIVQSSNALAGYAKEGLAILDTIKGYKGDNSLKLACKQALQFYQKLGETDIPKLSEFYLAQENFDKIKKSFDAKVAKDRTQQDVDAYNKAVNEVNAASNTYNRINTNINNNRKQVVDNWNNANETFLDVHVPHY